MLRSLLVAPLIAVATLVFATAAVLIALVHPLGADHLVRRWARWMLALGGVRVRVQGDGLPGPAVYASNHVSVLDIPILFGHLPVDFHIVYKRNLSLLPLIGWYLWLAGHFPIDRGNPFRAKRSLARAAERIRAGTSVAVFPEGTRRGTRGLGLFKRGSFLLALNAGVPVVPVSLSGLERVVPSGLTSLRAGDVTLRLHAPLVTAGRPPEEAEALANEVRAAVARGLEQDREA